VKQNVPRNDLNGMLSAIDKFGWKNWLMNVGDKKGLILDEAFRHANPKLVLELGTFFGYSSMRMARLLRADGGHITTIEYSPESWAIAEQLHEHAGVKDRITILKGDTKDVIPTLTSAHGFATGADFIFIDHWKDVYLRDFKLLEQHGLIRKGTWIVADNIIYPGAPDYLAYVQGSSRYRTQLKESLLEYSESERDAVAVSETLQ